MAQYFAYTDNGREHTGIEVFSWAEQAAALGAGEIIATSVDRDGTGLGYDQELIQGIARRVTVPVVAHGGAGKPNDLVSAVTAGADAVCVASILHYDLSERIDRSKLIPDVEGNTDFLTMRKTFGKVGRANLSSLRKALIENQIQCREQG
jgi:cyclase